MSKKPDDLTLLAELTRERDELDGAIETMIADMAEAAPENRNSGAWAPDGASTRRYLELTNRQAKVEREISDLTRAITAATKPTLPN
jgi:hypothetical protein